MHVLRFVKARAGRVRGCNQVVRGLLVWALREVRGPEPFQATPAQQSQSRAEHTEGALQSVATNEESRPEAPRECGVAGRGQDRGSASHGRCETGFTAQIARHPVRQMPVASLPITATTRNRALRLSNAPGGRSTPVEGHGGRLSGHHGGAAPPPGLHTTELQEAGEEGVSSSRLRPGAKDRPHLPSASPHAERVALARASWRGRQSLNMEAGRVRWTQPSGSRPLDSQFPLVFRAMARGLDTPPNAAAPVSKTPAEVWPDSGGGGGSSN